MKKTNERREMRSLKDLTFTDDFMFCAVLENDPDLRKRSRYYQSMIDRKKLGAGRPYSELRKTYIVFLCTFDLFGEGIPKYTFKISA